MGRSQEVRGLRRGRARCVARRLQLGLAIFACVACTGTPAATGTADAAADGQAPLSPAQIDAPGPWGIGIALVSAHDAARGRQVAMTVWYPTVAAADPGTPPAKLFYPGNGPLPEVYLKAEPGTPAQKGCVNPLAHGVVGAQPAAGTWPLVAFSHCSGCFGAASFSLAERLASHGIAVIAPDHPPNTVFQTLDGTAVSVTPPMLATRVADVRLALDVALDPTATALPAALRGRFDPQRVGVFGHSFGALTTGQVLADDARVKAGLAVAAPLSSPYPAGPKLPTVAKPVLLLLAREDNSILEIGNILMRNNFAAMAGPAWLVEVADAGHFSFSDTAGLLPSWHPGCGTDPRQTDDTQTVEYLPPHHGRAIAMRVVTAFFTRWLHGQPAAMAALELPWPGTVTVAVRNL